MFALALVMLAGCVLLLFWETYRLHAAAVMLLLFLAAVRSPGVSRWSA